jgi:hypothetical protein
MNVKKKKGDGKKERKKGEREEFMRRSVARALCTAQFLRFGHSTFRGRCGVIRPNGDLISKK